MPSSLMAKKALRAFLASSFSEGVMESICLLDKEKAATPEPEGSEWTEEF